MKKTYIVPNQLIVKLGTERVIAYSTLGYGEDITSGTTIESDVKENSVNDVNVWDEEW